MSKQAAYKLAHGALNVVWEKLKTFDFLGVDTQASPSLLGSQGQKSNGLTSLRPAIHLKSFTFRDPGKVTVKSLNGSHANAKTPRTPWEIEAWSGYMERGDRKVMAKLWPFLPNTLGSTPRLAKTSGRGSNPSISTTTSARDASRQIECKKVCQIICKN
jgi:hypothetical protein